MSPQIGLLLILLGVLSACSPVDERRDALDKQIRSEIAGAVENANIPSHATVENALLPPMHIPLPVSAPVAAQRFNLSVNNAPAREVFLGLAAGTPYSILLHPEVSGEVSLSLKNVTLIDALNELRDLYGYGYRIDGKRIVIQPLTMQTRLFRINYLIGSRRGLSDLRVISGSVSDSSQNGNSNTNSSTNSSMGFGGNNNNNNGTNSRSVENTHITTTSTNDFWTDLTRSLTDLVGHDGGRNVIANPQSGIVVVHATPNELRDVADFLRAMELSLDRQVILEAKIINVSLSDGFQSGINWAGISNGGQSSLVIGHSGQVAGISGNPSSGFTANASGIGLQSGNSTLSSQGLTAGGGLFGIAFANKNFSSLLEFLQTQGRIQVLSSPRIATLNNQKAVLKVGTDEFFVTGVSSSSAVQTNNTGSQTGNQPIQITPSVTLQPFFSGITLDVTPQIDDGKNVTLHIHPSVSEVSSVTKIIGVGTDNPLSLPLARSNVTETDSIIRTHDGQIVAIGGLMTRSTSDDHSQLPGLGDLPAVGGLFRNTNQSLVKNELVILLKTTVIEDDATWAQSARDFQQTFSNPPSQSTPQPP